MRRTFPSERWPVHRDLCPPGEGKIRPGEGKIREPVLPGGVADGGARGAVCGPRDGAAQPAVRRGRGPGAGGPSDAFATLRPHRPFRRQQPNAGTCREAPRGLIEVAGESIATKAVDRRLGCEQRTEGCRPERPPVPQTPDRGAAVLPGTRCAAEDFLVPDDAL